MYLTLCFDQVVAWYFLGVPWCREGYTSCDTASFFFVKKMMSCKVYDKVYERQKHQLTYCFFAVKETSALKDKIEKCFISIY